MGHAVLCHNGLTNVHNRAMIGRHVDEISGISVLT